jgi:hypothetical protein
MAMNQKVLEDGTYARPEWRDGGATEEKIRRVGTDKHLREDMAEQEGRVQGLKDSIYYEDRAVVHQSTKQEYDEAYSLLEEWDARGWERGDGVRVEDWEEHESAAVRAAREWLRTG